MYLVWEVLVVRQQLLEINGVLIKKHTCNPWSIFLTISMSDQAKDGVTHEVVFVIAYKSVKTCNVNGWQLNLNWLLLSWCHLWGFLVKFVGWSRLLLWSWLLLLILSIILVSVLAASCLSSTASTVVILVATSRSVVEFVSSIAAHILHWVLLRVWLMLLILHVLPIPL